MQGLNRHLVLTLEWAVSLERAVGGWLFQKGTCWGSESVLKGIQAFLAIGLHKKSASTWKYFCSALDLSPILLTLSFWFFQCFPAISHHLPACVHVSGGVHLLYKARASRWLCLAQLSILLIFMAKLQFPLHQRSTRSCMSPGWWVWVLHYRWLSLWRSNNSLIARLKPSEISENHFIDFPGVWTHPNFCPSGRNFVMVLVV